MEDEWKIRGGRTLITRAAKSETLYIGGNEGGGGGGGGRQGQVALVFFAHLFLILHVLRGSGPWSCRHYRRRRYVDAVSRGKGKGNGRAVLGNCTGNERLNLQGWLSCFTMLRVRAYAMIPLARAEGRRQGQADNLPYPSRSRRKCFETSEIIQDDLQLRETLPAYLALKSST